MRANYRAELLCEAICDPWAFVRSTNEQEACKWGAPPPAFIAAKPDLYCIQGQTRFAVFSDVFSSDLNLPRNNAGILSGVPFTSGAGVWLVNERLQAPSG